VHDFIIPELGKAGPYGVYDIAANTGWVNLGINHDTAAFAVESIRRWWHELGATRIAAPSRGVSSPRPRRRRCGNFQGPGRRSR